MSNAISNETSRNIFIAVGSTAVNGLIHLLRRLKEDGIYDYRKEEGERDDHYIGIDSDAQRLEDLKNIDLNSSPIRIHEVQLALHCDSPEREVITCFDQGWKDVREITASGVGGDRRLSFTTLNWRGFWDEIDIDKLLDKGDRVILLGTAFGGTSTGLFWNISEFIQQRIRSKIGTGLKGDIKFFGMLLLPEKNAKNPDNYPLSRNLCAFLKDMQLLEWRQLLEQQMNNMGRCFLSPVYSAWKNYKDKDNNKKSKYLPVFNSETFSCAEASNLPMDTLFVLPTPENAQGQTKSYFAELIFILFYLSPDFPNRITSTTVDKRGKYNQEELSFGGFNTIVARSAGNAILKARYYSLLQQHWKNIWDGSVSSNGDKYVEDVCKIISNVLTKDDKIHAANLSKRRKEIEDYIDKTPLKVLDDEFVEKLDDFATNYCKTTPYTWHGVETLIQDVMEKHISSDIPLAAITGAYQKIYDKFKEKAKGLPNLQDKIAYDIHAACRIQKKRGRSKITRLVNGSPGAKAEVLDKIRKYLHNALTKYIDYNRSAATLPSMPEPLSMEGLKKQQRFMQNANTIKRIIETSPSEHSKKLNGFIFEDSDKNSGVDLSPQNLNFTDACLETLLAKDESALMATARKWEAEGLEQLRKQAENMKENNPLKRLHTRIPVNELNSYSADVFKIEDTGKGLFHFCYTCGARENIDWPTWSELKSGLGFPSFGKFPGAGAPNSKAVLDDDKLLGPGDNSWFNGNRSSGIFQNIQGIWLGTLDLNQSFGEIMKTAFRGAPIDKWQQEAWENEEQNGAPSYRLQSLRNMIYLGVVLGAIEKKTLDITKLSPNNFNNVKLNLRIRSGDADSPIVLEEKNADPSDLGFSSTRLRMADVKLDWIEKLIRWFSQKSDNSFVQTFGLDKHSIEGKLLFERQCISNLKLQVPPDYLKDIEELFDNVYKRIEVEQI